MDLSSRWKRFWTEVGLPHIAVFALIIAILGLLALLPEGWREALWEVLTGGSGEPN